jgi:hypothetical protein
VLYFLLSTRSIERALGYDFGSRGALGFHVDNFVALGKASLAEQFLLGVTLDEHFAISFCNLLLDDLLLGPALPLRSLRLVHSKI